MAKNDQPGTSVVTLPGDERSDPRRQQQWERFWQAVDRVRERNADKDPDEVYRIVTEAVEEVRQEHYEREQRAAKRGD